MDEAWKVTAVALPIHPPVPQVASLADAEIGVVGLRRRRAA